MRLRPHSAHARFVQAVGSLLAVAALSAVDGVVRAQEPLVPTVDQGEFFETEIRPLLADNCFRCHSARAAAPFAGLRLDSRNALLSGGDSGLAIVPGRPQDSPLLERLHGHPIRGIIA
jgi:hypothetical protein